MSWYERTIKDYSFNHMAIINTVKICIPCRSSQGFSCRHQILGSYLDKTCYVRNARCIQRRRHWLFQMRRMTCPVAPNNLFDHTYFILVMQKKRQLTKSNGYPFHEYSQNPSRVLSKYKIWDNFHIHSLRAQCATHKIDGTACKSLQLATVWLLDFQLDKSILLWSNTCAIIELKNNCFQLHIIPLYSGQPLGSKSSTLVSWRQERTYCIPSPVWRSWSIHGWPSLGEKMVWRLPKSKRPPSLSVKNCHRTKES